MRSDVPDSNCPVCTSDDQLQIEAVLAAGDTYGARSEFGISTLALNRHHLGHPKADRDKRRTRLMVFDLAESEDYTAGLALDVADDTYDLVGLRRWRGVPYIAPDGEDSTTARIVQLVRDKRPALVGLDGTGVGRPVVQEVRKQLSAQLDPGWKDRTIGVYIAAGDPQGKGQDRTVGKTPLVSAAVVAVQQKRVRRRDRYADPETDALVPVLMEEMAGFRQARKKSGGLEYGNDVGPAEWRTARHDDMVLALAIGVLLADEAVGRQRALACAPGGPTRSSYFRPGGWW